MRLSAINTLAATLGIGIIVGLHSAAAQRPSIWLALPEKPGEFSQLFAAPAYWNQAAHNAAVFSLGINYLARTPAPVIARTLSVIQAAGLQLEVGLPALPVDKRVCGNKTEGMIWPGEAGVDVKHLKSAGVSVDYFAFDLPLTNGHVTRAGDACRLSVQETAKRLASTMRVLRAAFPSAKFVDVEVPTGMPTAQWTQLLSDWLSAIKDESGEQFYSLTMDVWWEFQWNDTVRQSVALLHQNGVRAGTFIDADKGPGMNAQAWMTMAKRHACDVLAVTTPDYVVVANWMQPDVPLLPETNTSSLLSLANWYASPHPC